jgi:hypothetical protein
MTPPALSRCLETLKLEVGIGERIHLGVRYNTNTLATGQHRSLIGWLVWFVVDFIFCVLTPLSAIFQLYHGDQF